MHSMLSVCAFSYPPCMMNMKLVDYDYGNTVCHRFHDDYDDDDAAFSM